MVSAMVLGAGSCQCCNAALLLARTDSEYRLRSIGVGSLLLTPVCLGLCSADIWLPSVKTSFSYSKLMFMSSVRDLSIHHTSSMESTRIVNELQRHCCAI